MTLYLWLSSTICSQMREQRRKEQEASERLIRELQEEEERKQQERKESLKTIESQDHELAQELSQVINEVCTPILWSQEELVLCIHVLVECMMVNNKNDSNRKAKKKFFFIKRFMIHNSKSYLEKKKPIKSIPQFHAIRSSRMVIHQSLSASMKVMYKVMSEAFTRTLYIIMKNAVTWPWKI